MSDPVSRRDFVGDTAKLAFGAAIVPRFVLGGPGFKAPSAKLNIGCVGIGGMGMSNLSQLLDENIVAICDVDFPYVERALQNRLNPPRGQTTSSPESLKLKAAYDKATKYGDFREMLAKEKDLDAVVIATPDHMHASIAYAAMMAGKHVYVQKPLTYSVAEARLLAKVAAEKKVVTQMGNQGHSQEGTRRIKEIVASGILGPIKEVHVWTDRPVRYWAQGIPRPQTPAQLQEAYKTSITTAPRNPQLPAQWNKATVDNAVRRAMAETTHVPPAGFNWDLYLGVAQEIPYHPAYHPFAWRGWLDFGVGAIGDMGAHLIDQPFWALDLEYPTMISGTSTQWGGPKEDLASYPLATFIQYEFGARGKAPPVKMYWYDGGLMPPRPPQLPDNMTLLTGSGDGGGGLFVGEKGVLQYDTYGQNPRVYPETLRPAVEKIPKTVDRVTTSHEMNWAQACKGEAKISSPFEYAAKLTETMLLGIVALKVGQGERIVYDGKNMKITNKPDANKFLTRQYRAGWELPVGV
ncbi:MAG: Gfo/Idh/MocA family oxidoreductase [Gemmatimonas sp.]